MAANPDQSRTSQSSSGLPQYTNVKINNSSDQTLVKEAVIIWKGSQLHNLPNEIVPNSSYEFKHVADNGGSVVGLEFKFKNCTCSYTLIITWSNTTEPANKVYAEIVQPGGVVNWDQIKTNLEKSQSQFDTGNQGGYEGILAIDPDSGTPTLTATFAKAT